MVKITHVNKINQLIFVLAPVVLLLSTIIIVGSAQLVDQSQPQPQPLTSNNNLLQNVVQNPFVNCTVATTKPTTSIGKYAFKSCIVAQLSAFLTIGPNKFVELNKGVVNTTNSDCGDTKNDPKLVIDYPCASIAFSIAHTNDSKTFVQSIAGQYHIYENGKDNLITFTNVTPRFNTTAGHYYKCNSEQGIVMQDNNTKLNISNFALEAYRDTTGTDFYQIPEECALDSQPVSDLVRIGVGVCLVALVAIVLIAYFIGRRRWSERSSYESV